VTEKNYCASWYINSDINVTGIKVIDGEVLECEGLKEECI